MNTADLPLERKRRTFA